jgi:LuxR family glucitol operon transcriptional activator
VKAVGWQWAAIAIQNWLADVALEQGNLEEAQYLLERGLPVVERNKDNRAIAFHKRSFASLEQLRENQPQAHRWATEAAEDFGSVRMISEAREMQSLLQALVWYQWSLGILYITLLLWTLSHTIPGLD